VRNAVNAILPQQTTNNNTPKNKKTKKNWAAWLLIASLKQRVFDLGACLHDCYQWFWGMQVAGIQPP